MTKPFPYEFVDREDWPPSRKRRKRRMRRPTMRSVIAQAKRAGVSIGQITVTADGNFVVVPSQATLDMTARDDLGNSAVAGNGNPWDEVLQ